MEILVHLQCRICSKRLWTNGTLVGLHIQMNHHVQLQGLLQVKVLSALIALPPTGFIFDGRLAKRFPKHLPMRGHVRFENVFIVNLFSANGAGGFFSAMYFRYVFLQNCIGLEQLAAFGASRFRRDSVIDAKMSRELRLKTEDE